MTATRTTVRPARFQEPTREAASSSYWPRYCLGWILLIGGWSAAGSVWSAWVVPGVDLAPDGALVILPGLVLVTSMLVMPGQWWRRLAAAVLVLLSAVLVLVGPMLVITWLMANIFGPFWAGFPEFGFVWIYSVLMTLGFTAGLAGWLIVRQRPAKTYLLLAAPVLAGAAVLAYAATIPDFNSAMNVVVASIEWMAFGVVALAWTARILAQTLTTGASRAEEMANAPNELES